MLEFEKRARLPMDQGPFLFALSTMLAIMNPIGILPVFLSMTSQFSEDEVPGIALKCSVLGALILSFWGLAGKFLFQVFNLEMHAFQIAGGIFLFIIALDMLQAKTNRTKSTAEEREESTSKDDIIVFPLTVPLLVGPGSIASVLMLAEQSKSTIEYGGMIISIFVSLAVVYFSLRYSLQIARTIGVIGINILTRFMGLILGAIAVRFVLTGLKAFYYTLV